MPSNPINPQPSSAIDRLSLGMDTPRGTQSAGMCVGYACQCFESEPSGILLPCTCAHLEEGN